MPTMNHVGLLLSPGNQCRSLKKSPNPVNGHQISCVYRYEDTDFVRHNA